jgi:hypothetical protein
MSLSSVPAWFGHAHGAGQWFITSPAITMLPCLVETRFHVSATSIQAVARSPSQGWAQATG